MIRTKESLTELLKSPQCFLYVETADTPKSPRVVWHIYGDGRYNLLWIVLSNIKNGRQWVECIKPQWPIPLTENLDKENATLIQDHARYMWEKYKKEFDE